MYFGSFTDSKGNLFDIVHFPKSIDKYPLRARDAIGLKAL